MKKIVMALIIVISTGLALCGAVVTATLVWVFRVGTFRGYDDISGFFVTMSLLGIIPLALGIVLFVNRKSIAHRIAGNDGL
ncbi:MAG: hypothetical protein E4G96_08130 [Chrysiogenales bacterium]|nr:MAG: hypothetical protein E4G96_08130 [Chrysiogenales bacterium]